MIVGVVLGDDGVEPMVSDRWCRPVRALITLVRRSFSRFWQYGGRQPSVVVPAVGPFHHVLAISSLIFFFVVGLVLMAFVDERKARVGEGESSQFRCLRPYRWSTGKLRKR